MAESIKISELDELVSGSILGTTKVPVVDAGATKYAQASSIKAYVNSDVVTDAELANSIAGVNLTIGSLTTADITENASNKYYTDARVTSRLNALSVLSGSSTSLTVTDGVNVGTQVDNITFSGAEVTNNGGGDVTVTITTSPTLNVIGGATNVSSVDSITFTGATVTNNGNGDVAVTIPTETTNISSLNSFTGSIRDEINGIEAFTASFSSSAASRLRTLETTTITLPNGLVSSSAQINYYAIPNIPITGGGAEIPLFLQGTNITITSSSIDNTVTINSTGGNNLGTRTNYNIISQSIIATDPIDSNLLLSSVYIDKTKTITFSQFSQSVDFRIGLSGGSNYISNVAFNNNNQLVFTGNGFAFNGNVTLANGMVSSSNQITALGFVQNGDVDSTYIKNRLPSGVISGSTQISSSGFLNNSSGVISSSAQIVLVNTISGGFDTSRVAENVNYQYYTNAKVQNVLNALELVSGSLLPSGSVSSSSQIDYQLVYNKVEFYSGSSNVFITSGSPAGAPAYGSPWVKIQVLSPTLSDFSVVSNIANGTLVSGSTQISNLGFINNAGLSKLNDWTGSTGGFGIQSQSINFRINQISSSIGTGGGTSTLSGLTDTEFNSLFSGDMISYNSAAGYWENTKQLSGNYVITGSLIVTGSITTDEYTALTYVSTPTIQSDTTLDITSNGSVTITPTTGNNVIIEDVLVLNKVIGNSPILPPTGSLMNSGSINGDSKLWFFNGTIWKEISFV